MEITLASTEKQRQAAYRLRYSAFEDQMVDSAYLDHARREFRDSFDESPTTPLWVAEANGTGVVGTLRAVYRSQGPYANDAGYNWALVSRLSGVPLETIHAQTAVLDRGAVHPDFRRQGLLHRLFGEAEKTLLCDGRSLVLAITRQPHVANFLRRRGYQHYQSSDFRGQRWDQLYRNYGAQP